MYCAIMIIEYLFMITLIFWGWGGGACAKSRVQSRAKAAARAQSHAEPHADMQSHTEPHAELGGALDLISPIESPTHSPRVVRRPCGSGNEYPMRWGRNTCLGG